ncbi:MAG: type I restriction enzyme endonuclease domain-containing protein [Cyanobium sp.]
MADRLEDCSLRRQASFAKSANRSLEAAQVIEELIAMAKQFREEAERVAALGLSPAEEAFYDSLANNASAQELMGDELLLKMARELADKLRGNLTIDWEYEDNVRARLRTMIRPCSSATNTRLMRKRLRSSWCCSRPNSSCARCATTSPIPPPISPSANQPSRAAWPSATARPAPTPSGSRCSSRVQQQLLPNNPALIGTPTAQDPALVNFILLITILVAFLEATARQIKPVPPALVMGFSGGRVGLWIGADAAPRHDSHSL